MKLNKEIISSRSNPLVKWASSLSDKKGREAAKSFIAEGKKLSYEALSASLPVSHIFLSEDKAELYISELKNTFDKDEYKDTELVVLSAAAFDKISTEKSPQGIISVIKYLDFFQELDIIYKEEFFPKDEEKLIMLSSVRDPGNLGSVIRSAVAFGAERIIVSSDTAEVYNPKTVRSALGSLFRVKISPVADMSEFVKVLRKRDRRVYAAELSEKAVSLTDLKLRPTDVFIIGNEGHGIDKEISSVADGSVYIPICTKTESLNAAVAAGIFIWEQSKL